MDHYIILNWVENSGSYTKSHGMPPRPLWVCPQEQWPVDCTQVCMPLLPLLLNTSFFAAGCMLSKKVNGSTCAWDCSSRALCEVWLSSQATKVQRILFNKVLMNELLTNTQTTHNNRWSSLTLLCTGNLNSIAKGSRSSRCLQQRRQSWHFRQWSRRLLSQCSQVLTSFWNDPTYPNVTQLSTPTASCNSATRSSEDFAC